MTVPRYAVILLPVLGLFGCSSSSDSSSAPGPDASLQEDTGLAQDGALQQDAAPLDALPADTSTSDSTVPVSCSVGSNGECTPADQCCPLDGRAYHYDPAHECKSAIDTPNDSPVLCYPGYPPGCSGYTAPACYVRHEADGSESVFLIGNMMPSESVAGSGVELCPEGLQAQVEAAPNCDVDGGLEDGGRRD